ncbi:MAG: hypothetical protein WCI72_02995 [archaeon]
MIRNFVKRKVYKKKIGDFHGYSVWYVNGYWVRNNLDRDFTNFGGNRLFAFIPKDEFWIDYENGDIKEAKYFFDSFLTIEKGIESGKTHEESVKIADRHEKMERHKAKFLKVIKKIKVKEKVLKRVHKKFIFANYTENLKIYIVRGDLVRSLFNVDFTQGGHDKVYNFIPKNEVWIDDDLYKKEMPYVLVHELHERYLMSKGWPYDSAGGGQKVFAKKEDERGGKSAHFAAEDLEFWCREHPKSVRKIIAREITRNEKMIGKGK